MATKRKRQSRTAAPGSRPLRSLPREEVVQRFAAALTNCDGVAGAHCIHELWMRHEPPMNVERTLEQLWRAAPESVPDWLPMRHVEWLPLAYEVAARFEREGRGRTNLYLVLLDYDTRTARADRTACTSGPRTTRPRCGSTSTRRGFGRRGAC